MRRRSFVRNSKRAEGKQQEENIFTPLFKELRRNADNIKEMLDDPDDLVIREFTVGEENYSCAVVYIDGLIDRDLIQNSMLESLQNITIERKKAKIIEVVFEEIYKEFISITKIDKGTTLEDVSNAILSGKAVFYLDGMNIVLIMDAWVEKRVRLNNLLQKH